jgi:glycosyltransferase involved in cell wall biosynthesis
MPVFNGERYMAEALESLLGQTFGELELLIVDNASTDATRDIAEDFARRDDRVRYHRNASNIGAAPNFNLAVELTEAPLFKWAAHDDRVLPTYLERCVSALDADERVVLAHSHSELIDETGATRPHDEFLTHLGDPRPSVRFRDMIIADHWCLDVFGVVRRSALVKTPIIASYTGSDRNLLAELALLGPIHRVPDVLFQNRDHPERSVHATSFNSEERLKWFDTKLRKRVTLPHARCLFEYARSVQRVDLPPAERLACYRAIASCVVQTRWYLKRDLRNAFAMMTGRPLTVEL